MSIAFTKDRWAQVKENSRKWWNGELVRPLFNVSAPNRQPDRGAPAVPNNWFHSFYEMTTSADEIIDCCDYNLAQLNFYGDAFPSLWPNFGPGVVAAFLGAELRNGENTVWFHARHDEEIEQLRFSTDEQNPWVERISALYRAGIARWEGLVQLGFTDFGGALDILSTFRPSEKLLFDLYDYPEAVKARSWEIHEYWWKYFSHFSDMLQPVNPGYSAWASIFSEDPTYMLQCDFSYMIGPEMFEEFVLPEIAASCRRLTNAFYHLDGPGELPHLDALLRIPELKGIQWVPGDGQPDISQWPEVYRKIRDAGKLIQVFTSQYPGGFRIIDVLTEQLGSAEGIVVIGSARPDEVDDLQALLKRYGAMHD